MTLLHGVLAVVAAGIFVATFTWPYVDDHHSMHNVWHWIEWVGNTLIFLLAGRGLHSSTFRLDVSAFCGIGGAFRGFLGGV